MFAIAMMIALADPPKPDLDPWTPRPAVGKAEPWEKAGEKEWVDDRFQKMDTGPFLNASFRYKEDGRYVMVYKGTAIRFKNGGALFDREKCKFVCIWKGGFLKITDRRFGLLNTPEPDGEYVTYNTMSWPVPYAPDHSNGNHEVIQKVTESYVDLAEKSEPRFLGVYIHANEVVFNIKQGPIYRVIRTQPPNDSGRSTIAVRDIYDTRTPWIDAATPLDELGFLKEHNPRPFTKPGPKRWGNPIVTPFVRGHDNGPFAIDTITIPYKNRFNALFFCTGLDFLPDGRLAVCTAHGDVWLVNGDDSLCSWQRYATGLYQPLGLKVVDNKVVVLERGQLTRLHDNNDDGEADYYENINSDWHLSGGEHSYNTCLETDPLGNYYFFATGDTDTETGGSLLKVSADGSKMERFATGFRHPIGLGMSPTGIVTGADQEGNWMPATRIDEYVQGGFYGDMRAHHREVPPKIYNGPLCWLPREVDNSAGGQVWVPKGTWGELGGLPLHLSYGRCKMFILLRQPLEDHPTAVSQGGVWDLNLRFLSGVCRGRFYKNDLYVCGLNGWQTAAKADGCLQRVRRTDKPLAVPVKLEVVDKSIEITFNKKLDAKTVVDQQFDATWWNYHWSEKYGSQRYKPSNDKVGQERVPIASTKLLKNQQTVRLSMPKLEPVMQLHIGIKPLLTVDGTLIAGSIYMTVHEQ